MRLLLVLLFNLALVFSCFIINRSSSISITETWFYIGFFHIHQNLLLNDETTKQDCDLISRPVSLGWVTSSGYN